MRLVRSLTLLAVLAACLAGPAGGDEGPPAAGGSAGSMPPAPGDARDVPCSPVATVWPVTASGPATVEAPQLSVVVTDIRPKDGLVYVDGRFAGRSRYFNGTKGFLYLEPGSYRLELRMDGYRTEAFTIAAQPSCLFEIRHRLERARGATAEAPGPAVGKGEPVQWIWAPLEPAVAAMPPAGRTGAPNPALRPDLGLSSSTAPTAELARGALRLHINPSTAEVYLDGSFLATARELDLMVSPVAVPVGRHVLELRAPGFMRRTEEISVAAGAVVELDIVLARGPL
jgi:PEGA domain